MHHSLAIVRRVALAGSVVFGLMVLAHGLLSLGRNWIDPGYWEAVLAFFGMWMLLGTLMLHAHPRPPTFAELLQAMVGACWLSLLILGGVTLLAGLLSLVKGWNLLPMRNYVYGLAQLYLLAVAITLLVWAAPFNGRWDADTPRS